MSNPEKHVTSLEDVENDEAAVATGATVDAGQVGTVDEGDEAQTTLHEVDVMELVKHMGLQQRYESL